MKVLDIRKRILKVKNSQKKKVENDRYDEPFRVEDGRNHGYFTVDDLFVDEYMRIAGANVVMIYLSLCRHADKDKYCWPSIRRLAMQGKMALNTVEKSIRWLEDHRLLKADREKGQPTVYKLLEKSKWWKVVRVLNQIRPATYREMQKDRRDEGA